jgi:hypothetical protein
VGAAAAWCLIAVRAFAILKTNTEYKNNVQTLRGRHVDEPFFERFFAQDLFTRICPLVLTCNSSCFPRHQ